MSTAIDDWDPPLKKRRGSAIRLCGLDVYYDFDWLTLFPDRRAQFKHGQALAQRVRSECPEGKRPALLLTTRDDVDERPIEAESDYIVVVNLPRYLAEATADAAVSYWAREVGLGG
jgi:hypothetical protein